MMPQASTAGANQTVLEDAGALTVANWASGMSAGPADEVAPDPDLYGHQ
jgi:hypothetical protein